ncbi:MAG TPA: 30S ribosomal protein S18 [Coxiellaceae bacterium]|nr:30S ribosomal protein S18 [Coxiellaceae bacterium]
MTSYNKRKKVCPFKSGKRVIDYKNTRLLRDFITESGRIVPSRITGVSAKFQRQLVIEIARARILGLLPFCDSHD